MKKLHYSELGLVNTKEMFAKAMARKYAVPAYTAAIRQIFDEDLPEFDPRKYLGPARDALAEMFINKNIAVLVAPVNY